MREPTARTRHYGAFYGYDEVDAGRPLWLVIGNCQAEALRLVVDGVLDRPYATARVPPVHELEGTDLPALRRLLNRAAVLLCQPIRAGYRDLPLGTRELTAELPRAARVLRWPVIRYAGLHPFQAIVRHPADRSVTPPVVPYHDLRTVVAARDGRRDTDEWDVAVAPDALAAVADLSRAELGHREEVQCDVGISDVLIPYGADAAHTINHPGNRVLTELGRRVLASLDVDLPVPERSAPLLGSITAPLERRVLTALGVVAPERLQWRVGEDAVLPEVVHLAQLRWYRDHPDYVRLAVARHAQVLDLLGLRCADAA